MKEKESPEKKSLLQLFSFGLTAAKIGKHQSKTKKSADFLQEKGKKKVWGKMEISQPQSRKSRFSALLTA